MKRGFLVTVCGAAVVIAGLSGCSSDKKSSSATTSAGATTTSAAATASATAAPGAVKVVIDGQEQNVQGTVVCTSMGGNMNIAIGDGGTGIAAVLSEADPPTVTSVALGNINGVNLGYTAGVPGGSAEATKDGKTYTIKGTATGMDMANPMQPVTKPFELTVTCP